jgi:multidrug efflux pump subunit AcrB
MKFILSILKSKFKKFLVIMFILLSLAGSIMMFPTKLVLAKMLPGKSTNTFSIYVDTPSGSSIIETKQITDCVVDILHKEKEVTDIEVFLGQGSPLDYAGLVKGSTFKNQENLAEVVVNLTDKHSRKEKSFLMVQRLRPIIQTNCEKIKLGTNIKMIEQPAGPPTLASIVIELYGDNSKKLSELSKEIADILRKTDGLVDVDILGDEIYPKFELKVDKEKVLRSGLSIKQVNEILYLAFKGLKVAVKNSENSLDQIPLFLTLSDETKQLNGFSKIELMNKFASLKLMNKDGIMVPVSELIYINKVNSNPTIMSKNLREMNTIVAETDMVSQVYPLLEARDMIKKQLSDRYEITNTYLFNYQLKDKKTNEIFDLVWDGEMKVTMDTFRDLGGAFIAGLILIYLLILVYYRSFVLSGIVLAGSFLSIIGVIAGHWVMDTFFTTETFFLTATSLIGFIALMGISSRNSLLLIDFTKTLILERDMDKKEAVALATATRARPILLTALAIILASTLLASDPVFGGLGVALIFGTIAAVIVSLLFIPVLIDNAKIMNKENLEKL